MFSKHSPYDDFLTRQASGLADIYDPFQRRSDRMFQHNSVTTYGATLVPEARPDIAYLYPYPESDANPEGMVDQDVLQPPSDPVAISMTSGGGNFW